MSDSTYSPGDLDGLAVYRKATAHRVLSRREETQLGKRKDTGDRDAHQQLVLHNLRLVYMIASRYQGHGLTLDDLIQHGTLGLIRAVDKYDWQRGYKFSTYATWWIRQAVQRGVIHDSQTVRLPVHIADRVRRVKAARAKHWARHGLEPDEQQLATAAQLTITHLRELDTLPSSQSLDGLFTDDDDNPAGFDPPDPCDEYAASDARDARDAQLRLVGLMLGGLPARERRVLELRYGLSGREHTLQEVADEVGVTRERVRQIQEQALRRLRARLLDAA